MIGIVILRMFWFVAVIWAAIESRDGWSAAKLALIGSLLVALIPWEYIQSKRKHL